jgi:uncharacterized protein YneR
MFVIYLLFFYFLFFLLLNLSFGRLTALQAKEHFNEVLFIIKYNYNAPINSIVKHCTLWSSVFQNQVVFAPYNLKFLNSAGKSLAKIGVKIISCLETDKLGYLAYQSVITAMRIYPQYKGYLYTHDDMALNISKLYSFNLSYSWRTDGQFFVNLTETWNFRNHKWPWFNRPWGISAMKNTLEKNEVIRERLRQCTGNEKNWFIGQSDFFYVPQHQISIFINVMSIFFNEKVFVEIALPTYLACFVPKLAIEELKLCSFWGKRRGNIITMSRDCPESSTAYHPVKLSGGIQAAKFMIEKSDVLQYENQTLLENNYASLTCRIYNLLGLLCSS